MERTSLADALDKLSSDVAAQSSAGLEALKDWLQDPQNLEKADLDPDAWPAVLKVLERFGRRQVQNLARAGGGHRQCRVCGEVAARASLSRMAPRCC